MKKILTVVMAMVMVLGLSVSVFAAPAPKAVIGELEVLTEGPIYVGETVNFRARILKHGSKFTSQCEGDVELSEDGYYVVEFSRTFTEADTYNVEYTMTMTAGNGKSLVQFAGSAATQVTVVERPVVAPQIVSYEITNWTKGTAILNPQGNTIGHNANGTLLAVYDNGSKVEVNNNFDFTLSRLNDNLQTPDTYNDLVVVLN
jgi:hypothetical protein